ncbi:MAG: DNA polymerase III subunit alpha [Bacteroidales bacterium]|nr:DNA polymerase III subunit alpha [Bacteroidales bacterium]
MSNFTHLHVHTQYSILDGLARIPDLIEKAYKDGQRAMAVTDHGNMYGIYTFVGEVEKFNKNHKDDPFKAIIGCEVYVAREGRLNKRKEVKADRSGHHLVLLAKNMIGYRNLSHLVSLGWTEGMYYTPRIDKEIMRQYSEGIIACSACLGGELPQVIMAHNPSMTDGTVPEHLDLEAAGKVVEEFKSIYGNDYYIELQRNGHKEQKMVNVALLQLAEKYGVRCIATNDVHFVNKEDYETHKMLICINTRKEYVPASAIAQDEDSDNGMAYSGEEYLRTIAEMEELFADHPEALSNTQHVADKVESFSLKHEPTLPRFEVPSDYRNTSEYAACRQDFIEPLRKVEKLQLTDEFDYLSYLTWVGARQRWGENYSGEIRERLLFELETVGKMGYPGYFLIVLDFIQAGKKNGIRFGPGRGSAAGSAIAYCLHITNVDPIKYDLLFERFLNPDRISLPDMDIDMDSTGRAKTIEYVSQKYGKEKVAVIVTLMEMKGRTAISDCARALNLTVEESRHLTKMMPDDPKITLSKAIETTPDLKYQLENGNKNVRETLEFALKLEGTLRGTGVHACGVIIGRDNLFDCIPLATSKNSDTMVTQYEGSLVEEAGLLKMDFLGLKTLDIITSALNNIKKSQGIDIEIDDIPLDDAKTYQLFKNGETTAIFQFESAGMRKYLRELQPDCFEDIIAMVSLYRPGPMDNIPSFIARKNGREKIIYPIPEMGQILNETYGITVYQEQVMLLSRLLADFTRGQADTLRKAMGKKKIDLMNDLKTKFIYGGTQKDYRKEDLDHIWQEWEKFASYAFNKSHATCYAFVSYQTAWLKANYMAEFLAANLTVEINDLKKVSELIEEASNFNIPVLPPDVNESELEFTVNKDGAIRFGLAALKGVGASAVADMIAERNANGKFKNIFDFMERINLRSCNRRVIESMASVGAFDNLGTMHRAQFFAEDKEHKVFMDKLMAYGLRSQDKSKQLQISIFDMVPEDEVGVTAYPEVPDCAPWSPFEQLTREKEIAGFYISGHPLDQYKLLINSCTNSTLADIIDREKWPSQLNRSYTMAVFVTSAVERLSQNGSTYGVITMEDYDNTFEWVLFGDDYQKIKHLCREGEFLYLSLRVTERGFQRDVANKRCTLKHNFVMSMQKAYIEVCDEIKVSIPVQNVSENLARILLDCVNKSEVEARNLKRDIGKVPVVFTIIAKGHEFNLDFFDYTMRVDPETFISMLPKTLPMTVSIIPKKTFIKS